MSQKQNNILPIAMMFLLFAMISFVTGLSSPLGVIVNNLGGAKWMATLGYFANFIAYLFMGLPAGVILKNKGYKFTALLAIGVGILGVAIQLISSKMPYVAGDNFTPIFAVYLLGAFIAGFSMCMLNTVVNPMLNTLGGGGRTGNQLVQFGGSVNSLSATIVPVLGGLLIGDVAKATLSNATPALLVAAAIFVTTFIVLYFVPIPEPDMQVEQVKEKKDTHSPLSFRHFVLGAVAIFLYVGIEVGVPMHINLLLTDTEGLAFDAGIAGSVVGVYWLLMMIGRIFGGVVAAKVSPKMMLFAVSAGVAVLTLAGIFYPINHMVSFFGMAEVPVSVLLFALCGLFTSVMWGVIFNLAVEGIGKYTAMGAGIFMVMVCGGGVLPLIQSAVADFTNIMASYWVIFAAAAYLVWYALYGSKNVNTDINVD